MGSGFRTFQSGEVLTAANVQDYLMDQSVMTFAGTAALGSAIGTAVEQGMVAYLTDSDQLVHYAANVADGTAWATIPMRGGPVNRIINGGMDVWQRGTAINHAASGYTADRYKQDVATAVPSGTVSRQSFTAGSAPAASYEAPYFMRVNITANNGCTVYELGQPIEDVRTFAGQTVTFSFWAKADAACTIQALMTQNFGSGGSTAVTTSAQACSLTTSWQRFRLTFSLGSMSGKTIGTSSFLRAFIQLPVTSGTVRVGTYDFWGWQVEQGSYASPFELEDYGTTLAKCQRYYNLFVSGSNKAICTAAYYNSTHLIGVVSFPVTMRTAPSLVVATGTDYYAIAVNNGADYMNSLSILQAHENAARLENTSEVSGTGGQAGYLQTSNASASIAFSAEL